MERFNDKGEEMTRYAFISHMENYMKQLLKDPQTAEPDEFLQSFGLKGPVCLELLLKRTDKNDPDSSIITRKERIVKGEPDEYGKPTKDGFSIKYRIPRKDYTKKMRNAYISIFENYRCDNNMLNEDDSFTDYSDIASKMDANINNTMNEDGEMSGGATSADSSGQYTQPLFGKPIRRKLYITKEQLEYVKNALKEECPAEVGSMFGDFGYDAPGLDLKNDPSLDHKDIMKKSWKGRKSDKSVD